MTDPIGTPKPPVGGDFTSGTFEQVLFAVTGHGPDLHGVLDTGATPGAGWYVSSKSASPGGKQEDGKSGGSGYSYHAWDKWYIAVDRDPTKPGNWDTAVDRIDELVNPLNAGKLGLMDVNRLRDTKAVVDQYVNWLATNHTTVQQWVNKLTSDDSAFKGKAAHAIQENLKRIAFTINDLHQQLTVDHKTPASLQSTADALTTFSKGMANLWTQYSGGLNYLVHNTMVAVVNNVHAYIVGKGLAHGTPNYVLDILAADSRERAEAYIQEVVTGYSSTANTGPLYTLSWNLNGGGYYSPVTATSSINQTGTYNFTPGPLPEGFPVLSGPLDSQSTWDAFNVAISDYARKRLEPLDTQARTLIADLQSAYDRTKKPLDELDTPTPPVTGGSGNNNPFGNFPPPGGTGNFPPPGGTGNFPPPGGTGNFPPPGGTGNFPPPGGTGNFPPPGGTGNVPPPGGIGNVPPPGGTGNVPPPVGNVPPPGGDSTIPPGGIGNQPPGGGPDSLGNTPPPGGEGTNGNTPPVLPPGMLPPSLSNSAPNNQNPGGGTGLVDENGNPIDANGNLVDENGNPIDPANGSGQNLPPLTSDLPDPVTNQPPGFPTDSLGNLLPGGDGNLPGGNSNSPGDFNSQSGDFGNLPGGDSNLPGDFSNLPGDFGNLPGGDSNLPGDFSNLPGDFGNLPGGDSNQPGGGPGGSSNLPGDFGNLPGGGAGGSSNLPGDFGNLPGGGAGGSSNLPGDFGNLPGGGGGAGGGAPGGDFSNLPGGGGAPGGGGGSAGGFGGEGWADWSGQGPETNNDGSPFGGPTGAQSHGGMPMMPPMMPPMNGGQGDSKERERQTWLSEDDKIWGTDSGAGNGIIGLPNDVMHEPEEPIAPAHVHVSSTPLRGKPAEQSRETTEQAAEQTATS